MSPNLLVRSGAFAARSVLVCGIFVGFVSTPVEASADAVADWNVIAVTQIGAGHSGPAGLIDLAVVQAAVHDAIQAYEQAYRPYGLAIANASGSQIAAVATAARDVLKARLPDAQDAAVEAEYQAYLAANFIAPGDPGIAVGSMAAAGVLALRVDDGSFPDVFPPFTGANEIGVWRPTPPANLAMHAPWAANVRPFGIPSTSRCRPAAPPALTSVEYAEAYNEVKALGSLASTARTPAQSYLARFYTDNFPAQWFRALRDISALYHFDAGPKARLLALASLASADAFICAWQAKTFYVLWRPITAIHEGDADGNDATAAQAGWTPFLASPNYPEYTSGANNLTSAMTRVLELFFGTDHVSFPMVSLSSRLLPEDSPTILYSRFSDVAKDVIDVRIWQGVHFRFGDTEARSQGRRVANYVFRNYLQPVDAVVRGNPKGDWDDEP